jgi:hypothetical protein
MGTRLVERAKEGPLCRGKVGRNANLLRISQSNKIYAVFSLLDHMWNWLMQTKGNTHMAKLELK